MLCWTGEWCWHSRVSCRHTHHVQFQRCGPDVFSSLLGEPTHDPPQSHTSLSQSCTHLRREGIVRFNAITMRLIIIIITIMHFIYGRFESGNGTGVLDVMRQRAPEVGGGLSEVEVKLCTEHAYCYELVSTHGWRCRCLASRWCRLWRQTPDWRRFSGLQTGPVNPAMVVFKKNMRMCPVCGGRLSSRTREALPVQRWHGTASHPPSLILFQAYSVGWVSVVMRSASPTVKLLFNSWLPRCPVFEMTILMDVKPFEEESFECLSQKLSYQLQTKTTVTKFISQCWLPSMDNNSTVIISTITHICHILM